MASGGRLERVSPVAVARDEQDEAGTGEPGRIHGDRDRGLGDVVGDHEHAERGQVVQAERDVAGIEPRTRRRLRIARPCDRGRIGILERGIDGLGALAIDRRRAAAAPASRGRDPGAPRRGRSRPARGRASGRRRSGSSPARPTTSTRGAGRRRGEGDLARAPARPRRVARAPGQAANDNDHAPSLAWPLRRGIAVLRRSPG